MEGDSQHTGLAQQSGYANEEMGLDVQSNWNCQMTNESHPLYAEALEK